MTIIEEIKEFKEKLAREKAAQDAAMAAMNLNFALTNYQSAGGELNPVSRRLLADTKRMMASEGVKI